MKKYIILLFVLCFDLFGYEYLIYENPNQISTNNAKYRYYIDDDGDLVVKSEYITGDYNLFNADFYFYLFNNGIKNGDINFITKDQFDNYLKNDLLFLNDAYTKRLQPFLNYFYNENKFDSTNHIYYQNYELLYNSDGLVVESIVDGIWAGLYSDSQKSKSGALYNKSGSMVYYNGKAVTATTSFLVWLDKFTNNVVIETFEEIQRSLVAGIIAAVVLVLAVVRLVLELLPSSITPRRRRYYGGGRGSLPDYDDGRQVAASVRARLAAKNKALKDRANGGSAVQQSNINGILFDLENER